MHPLLHPGAPVDLIVGSDLPDALQAANGGSRIYGMGGDDFLSGGGGADLLSGQVGDDNLYGGGGGDTLRGGVGSDTLAGGNGPDLLLGGSGFDTVRCLGPDPALPGGVGVLLDLRAAGPQDAGSDGLDTLRSIEGVIGTWLPDRVTGTPGHNLLDGDGGADTLIGLGGADEIYGDRSYWRDGPQRDLILGGGGGDFLAGAGQFSDDDGALSTLLGGGGDDDLYNGLLLKGGAGADQLQSHTALATLLGGDGDDHLLGFALQTLVGGAGHDDMAAIQSAATFLFRAGDSSVDHPDEITDFAAGSVIDLHHLSADAGRRLHLTQAFHDRPGDITLTLDLASDRTVVDVDLDGDGASDFRLLVSGHQLDLSEFHV